MCLRTRQPAMLVYYYYYYYKWRVEKSCFGCRGVYLLQHRDIIGRPSVLLSANACVCVCFYNVRWQQPHYPMAYAAAAAVSENHKVRRARVHVDQENINNNHNNNTDDDFIICVFIHFFFFSAKIPSSREYSCRSSSLLQYDDVRVYCRRRPSLLLYTYTTTGGGKADGHVFQYSNILIIICIHVIYIIFTRRTTIMWVKITLKVFFFPITLRVRVYVRIL